MGNEVPFNWYFTGAANDCPPSGNDMIEKGIAAPLAAALAAKGYETLTAVQDAVLNAMAHRAAICWFRRRPGRARPWPLAWRLPTRSAGRRQTACCLPMCRWRWSSRRRANWRCRSRASWTGFTPRPARRSPPASAAWTTAPKSARWTAARISWSARRAACATISTRKSLDLSGLRAAVLDEADEMLDLGFREDLEFILAAAPETPHADVLGHRAERHRQAGQGFPARRAADCRRRARRAACRYRISRAVGGGARPRACDLQRAAVLRGAHGDRVLQDAGERQPSVGADGQPGLSGRGAVGRAVASRNAPTRCKRCATGGRGSVSRPTWRRAGSTCRGWTW